MHIRTRKLVLAGLTACALAAAGALPAYASSPTWGYDSTPKDPTTGALDFSGWTQVSAPATGQALGSLTFSDATTTYTVTAYVPGTEESGPGLEGLNANVIMNDTTGDSNTYTYSLGSGGTSPTFLILPNVNALCIVAGTDNYYTMAQAGNLAVAHTVTLGDCNVTTLLTTVLYSEVLDISDTGQLIHTVTVTNINPDQTAVVPMTVLALLDTQLNGDDDVPIIAGPDGSAYMEDSLIHIDLKLLNGNIFGAGDWAATVDTYADVLTATAGDILASPADDVDTAVVRGQQADLMWNQSMTLSYSESFPLTTAAPKTETVIDSGGTVATAGGAGGLVGLLLVGLGLATLVVRRVRV